MKETDKFPNVYADTVTMSAANTLTFAEINLGVSLFDKVGIIINKMEYFLPQAIQTEMVAAADRMTFGLSASNQNLFNPNERSVIDFHALLAMQVGAVVSLSIQGSPIVHDFSNLPGGGLLTVPKPLYFALETAGFAALTSMNMRMTFQILTLKPDDYLELLESRRFYG